MKAQTFQATFTAKVKSAVPPVMPAANERFIQFGIGVIVRDRVILLKIAWFGGSRFVIADRAVPMLDCGGRAAGCGVEP